ncbi:MAG: glycosyltransferase family 2 protein [Methanoregula sp.]|jgi:GT2 family glycosyltransferase|nr:glycosyltransferase family 2 protein [Methanoregula sp.]
MDISFVILNYKTKGLLKNCLKSIIASDLKNLRYEIIVVDNASGDGVKEMLAEHFAGVIFIQNRYNLGMGAGNNLGIKQARGKYVIILNPDTVVFPDAVMKLYNFMEQNERAGIAGPKLTNPDGSLQYTRCRFPSFLTPVYRRTPLQRLKQVRRRLDSYLTKDQSYNITSQTDWLYGACLFIRSNALDKVGLFDERFFLGFEDTDLCRRMGNNGYEVWYYPASVAIHYPHRFSGEGNWLTGVFNRSIRIHIASWLKYFLKWRVERVRSDL